MKNFKQYGIIVLMVAVSTIASAKVNNFIGLWTEFGEWSLLTQKSSVDPSLGYAGGVGLTYDLQKNHFLFDIGVGARAGQSFFLVGEQNVTLYDATDLDGERFNYVYNLRDRKDAYTNVMLQVPLMLGGQWGRFYFLAGAKLGLSMHTQTISTAMLDTYGDYAQYDDFRNMPEYQFFTNEPLQGGVKTKFRLNVDAAAEIGARVGFLTDHTGFDVPKSKVQYRIALFADYGLLDLHYADNKQPLITPSAYNYQDMKSGLVMNDLLSAANIAGSVNNLLVGVKFTVLFQLPEPPTCVICKDSQLFGGRFWSGKGKTKVIDD